MYVLFIPAQGVGQDVHRLVERDVPEIQKINAYKKKLHGFKDNKDALDCKKKENDQSTHLNTLIQTKKTLRPKIQVE